MRRCGAMEVQMPLSDAAADNDITIRRLVAEGADVNVQGVGAWPLEWAAMKGHVAAARVLVEVGAELEACTAGGWRPLQFAAHQGHVSVVKTLVELGADKEAANAILVGCRPLHLAAHHGHVTVVKPLEMGADKEATDADGWRPLHVAAGHGQVEVVTTLVELGADIGAMTDNGETPLQLNIRGC
jgi:ankyrin repeat protein